MSQPVNFNDLLKAADDAGFSIVPASDYEAEVATAEAKTTSTGKNQIAIRFKILAGPQAGKSVFNNFVISPDNANALGFFFRHMAALGLEREFFAGNPPLNQAAALLVGKRATITVAVEQWNGADRNRVNGVKKSGAGLPGVGATPFTSVTTPPQVQMPFTPPVVPAPQNFTPPPVVSDTTPPFTPTPVPPIVNTAQDVTPITAPEVPF